MELKALTAPSWLRANLYKIALQFHTFVLYIKNLAILFQARNDQQLSGKPPHSGSLQSCTPSLKIHPMISASLSLYQLALL